MLHEILERDGLILVDRIGTLLDDPRSLSRDAAAGRLVKLRRGAYVSSERWDASTGRQRHILRIKAAIAAAERPVTVAWKSAAALWGMPISGAWPTEVTFLDEWRGGGKSEPGVRFTSAGFRSAEWLTLEGIRTTSLARTAIDVARLAPLPEAIGSVDWALWRKNPSAVTSIMLHDELDRLDSRRGLAHMREIVGFATPLSDSFGESRARAVMHLLGFGRPDLQIEFKDQQGMIIPDFYWRRENIAAEFDGKMKYTREAYTGGDPAEVVWKEKKREDRLRRMVGGVERLLTSDVLNPRRLEALLLAAGVDKR